METNKPKVLKWALIIGMVVVLNLFFNYTISLFYKAPSYDGYFPQQQVVEEIKTKSECLDVGGQWVENTRYYKLIDGQEVPQPGDYCDRDFTKRQEYDKARQSYERNIFIMLVVLGVLSLAIGSFLTNEILTLGLSWGGVLSLIIASVRYWSSADNLVKVIILALALVALIWLAVKKFGKQ